MSRYSLRLRDKYGQDEPTGSELIGRGIGNAIGGWAQRSETQRQERNTVGQAGGVILPDDPANSVRGRWDKMRRGIGSLLGHGIGGPNADAGPTITSNNRDGLEPSYTDLGGFTQRVPQLPPSMLPGGQNPGHQDGTGWDERMPPILRGQTAARDDRPVPFNEADILHPAPRVSSPRPIAANDAGAGEQRGIGGALSSQLGDDETYTYEGTGGMRARMPNAMGQSRIAARMKTAESHDEQERQIRSAIDAGMSPEEARVRVLNNIMRYDETFGQQRSAGRSGSGGYTTQEDRMAVQDRIDARQRRAIQLQRDLAAGRFATAAEERAARQELSGMRAEEDADQATLSSIQRQADAAQAAYDKATNDPFRDDSPAGVAAREALKQRAEQLGGRVEQVRAKVSARGTPNPPAPPVDRSAPTGMAGMRRPRGPSPRTEERNARVDSAMHSKPSLEDRARALKEHGMTKQQAYETLKKEGYNVAPPRTP